MVIKDAEKVAQDPSSYEGSNEGGPETLVSSWNGSGAVEVDYQLPFSVVALGYAWDEDNGRDDLMFLKDWYISSMSCLRLTFIFTPLPSTYIGLMKAPCCSVVFGKYHSWSENFFDCIAFLVSSLSKSIALANMFSNLLISTGTTTCR
jgi:hypothetical protein